MSLVFIFAHCRGDSTLTLFWLLGTLGGGGDGGQRGLTTGQNGLKWETRPKRVEIAREMGKAEG